MPWSATGVHGIEMLVCLKSIQTKLAPTQSLKPTTVKNTDMGRHGLLCRAPSPISPGISLPTPILPPGGCCWLAANAVSSLGGNSGLLPHPHLSLLLGQETPGALSVRDGTQPHKPPSQVPGVCSGSSSPSSSGAQCARDSWREEGRQPRGSAGGAAAHRRGWCAPTRPGVCTRCMCGQA